MRLRMLLTVLSFLAVSANAAGVTFADGQGLFNRRLGLFVHWGIYSVGAWHEQERMRLRVPRIEYEKFAERFTAEGFDADKIIDAAESFGAEYIVFTAKHHDGFCMWNTKTTDFNVMNTPAKRDVLCELTAACKRRGIKLGLYYSNPDWHHPNAYNPLSTHQVQPESGDEPNMMKYREYVKAQITELLTNYGEIVCLFWDIPTKIEDPEMNVLVRRLQPGIKINDRGWGAKGDYSTPEREVPEGSLFPRPTEACDSVGACSWGYRANEDYRTVGYLTRSIDAILSMGGNYLLNVGPKENGTIPAESLELLAKTGDWYGRVKESYHDVETVTNLVSDVSCFTTVRGNTVYLHYPKGLMRRGLDLSPMSRLPTSATLLNTGKALACEVVPMPNSVERLKRSCLHVSGIPADELANESVVVKLEFDGGGDSVAVVNLADGKLIKRANVGVATLDVDFVNGLLTIPSESRSISECNRAVAYVTNYLAPRGVYCHVVRTKEGREALYASTVPGKTCDYAYISHIDVVPADSPDQFVPKIVGDDIYARGACDTKINAALMLQSLVELKGKASVGAFIATDEDGCCGEVPTCTLLRQAGFTPKKMLIVGDTSGGTTNAIRIAQKGHWGFRLTARGLGGHSSIPWKLDNAIPKITAATEKLMAAYPKPPKDGGWCSTLVPTILRAGEAPNSIPDEASVTFSFRYIGKNDVADLRKLIVATTGLEPETLYCVPPVVNDPNDPLILEFRDAMQRFWPSITPVVETGNGATDAFQFSDLNLPTVIVTHNGQGGHRPNENGSLKSANEYLNFFVDWLQVER